MLVVAGAGGTTIKKNIWQPAHNNWFREESVQAKPWEYNFDEDRIISKYLSTKTLLLQKEKW